MLYAIILVRDFLHGWLAWPLLAILKIRWPVQHLHIRIHWAEHWILMPWDWFRGWVGLIRIFASLQSLDCSERMKFGELGLRNGLRVEWSPNLAQIQEHRGGRECICGLPRNVGLDQPHPQGPSPHRTELPGCLICIHCIFCSLESFGTELFNIGLRSHIIRHSIVI